MRAGLVLALLLAAVPAEAKLAVFTQSRAASFAGPTATQFQASLKTLAITGTPYTLLNASARTWGAAGTDDSVWFRQQGYEAVIVLCEDGQASGTTVVSGPYGTNFQDAGGDARVQDSPLSGLWGIPCHIFTPNRIVPTTSYDLDIAGTNDRYIPGILHTAPAGSFAKPSEANAGTWRYRLLARVRGSQTDTLYADPFVFACRPATFAGTGTVAALAWADSTLGGGCTAGDTAVAVWRYRPNASVPGATYYTLRLDYAGGYNTGVLWALQNIFTTTASVRPTQRRLIPLIEHDAQPVDETNSTHRANQQRLTDTLRVNSVGRWVATPGNPTEYGNLYDATSRATIRAGFTSGLNRWLPFSYSAGPDWDLAFYDPADTTGVRIRWNQVEKTMAHADSFNFGASRRNVDRIVSGAGEVGGWMTKVLADAGVKVVETTLAADRGPNWAGSPPDTGWALIAATNFRTTGSVPVAVPGTGETRVLWVQETFGFPHAATFNGLRAGVAEHEYIGLMWITSLGIASMRRASLYWHTGSSSGVAATDPYFSWLMSVAVRHVAYFDRVIGFDTGFANQIHTPRSKFTAR